MSAAVFTSANKKEEKTTHHKTHKDNTTKVYFTLNENCKYLVRELYRIISGVEELS
ncbi:MAG: hypothetical protein KG003_14525 [Bacteroidetes bacterium]|nr:hypothetical protein [Bacteroidota bacterium]